MNWCRSCRTPQIDGCAVEFSRGAGIKDKPHRLDVNVGSAKTCSPFRTPTYSLATPYSHCLVACVTCQALNLAVLTAYCARAGPSARRCTRHQHRKSGLVVRCACTVRASHDQRRRASTCRRPCVAWCAVDDRHRSSPASPAPRGAFRCTSLERTRHRRAAFKAVGSTRPRPSEAQSALRRA